LFVLTFEGGIKMGIKSTLLGAAVAAFASTLPALAVTISIDTDVSVAQGEALRSAFLSGSSNTQTVIENFEGFTACDGTNAGSCSATPINSKVGTFTGINGAVIGASPVAPLDEAVIRGIDQFGRFNTTAGGSNYIDSNDQKGIKLAMPGNFPLFDRMAFFLMDIDDVANFDFRITARTFAPDPEELAVVTNNQKWNSGVLHLVKIDFGQNVSTANIRMLNLSAEADGFGMDDFYVAAVPLPAGGLLLLTALGGLGFASRKRKKAA